MQVDGTLGNDPRDPSCLCIVLDDRLLAHQSNETWLQKDCYVGGMAWIGETQCNCTGQLPKSPIPQPGNPSLTHVGRMPVWLPYVGVKLLPYVPGDPQVGACAWQLVLSETVAMCLTLMTLAHGCRCFLGGTTIFQWEVPARRVKQSGRGGAPGGGCHR